MRPIFVALILVLAFSLTPVSARVGETLDQCKKRYGKATPISEVYDFGDEAKDLIYYNFQKNGIDILIGFLNGKAADLSFRHHHVTPDPTDTTNAASVTTPETPDTWTQIEIDTLLAANSSSLQWKTVPDGKLIFFPDCPNSRYTRYGAYQQRDDGVMSTVDDTTLHIFTPDWMTYINTNMQAHQNQVTEDQKKNLEGF